MTDKRSPGDAYIQRNAEAEIVEAASRLLGHELLRDRAATKIPVGDSCHVEVDAISEDRSVVVEAYARQGPLKGAQLKKIAQDVLKLVYLQQTDDAIQQAYIVFASEEAARSVRGWLGAAVAKFHVQICVVEISQDLRDAIIRAQGRQLMVSADLLADDVVPLLEGEDGEPSPVK